MSLLTLLFASLVCAAKAVRFYNHAGFIVTIPVGSARRTQWSVRGGIYLRRAGLLFSRALRCLVLAGPLLVCLLHPVAGPIAALLVVAALYRFDRVDTD